MFDYSPVKTPSPSGMCISTYSLRENVRLTNKACVRRFVSRTTSADEGDLRAIGGSNIDD